MIPYPQDILDLATKVLEACRNEGVMLATAESCTGGLIVGALTEIAGSSDVVDRGFITYSNNAKVEMLGVALPTLNENGAVSQAVALEMAGGAIRNSRALVAIAVTGIAGPGGGTTDKPVGTVHVAVKYGSVSMHKKLHLGDFDRTGVRMQTVRSALGMCLDALTRF